MTVMPLDPTGCQGRVCDPLRLSSVPPLPTRRPLSTTQDSSSKEGSAGWAPGKQAALEIMWPEDLPLLWGEGDQASLTLKAEQGLYKRDVTRAHPGPSTRGSLL